MLAYAVGSWTMTQKIIYVSILDFCSPVTNLGDQSVCRQLEFTNYALDGFFVSRVKYVFSCICFNKHYRRRLLTVKTETINCVLF